MTLPACRLVSLSPLLTLSLKQSFTLSFCRSQMLPLCQDDVFSLTLSCTHICVLATILTREYSLVMHRMCVPGKSESSSNVCVYGVVEASKNGNNKEREREEWGWGSWPTAWERGMCLCVCFQTPSVKQVLKVHVVVLLQPGLEARLLFTYTVKLQIAFAKNNIGLWSADQ